MIGQTTSHYKITPASGAFLADSSPIIRNRRTTRVDQQRVSLYRSLALWATRQQFLVGADFRTGRLQVVFIGKVGA